MTITFISYRAPTITLQLCTGPTDIWTSFGIPPAPWTSERDSGGATLGFNGHSIDAGGAVVTGNCTIFVTGFTYWQKSGLSQYSRVFSVSQDGGGSFTTLADIYPYQAGIVNSAYDPYNPYDLNYTMAPLAQGENIYVVHNTTDSDGQFNYGTPNPDAKNYTIVSKTTDYGNTWSHVTSTSHQYSTAAALVTNTGIFQVGTDIVNAGENGVPSNVYVSLSTDEGTTWTATKVLDSTEFQDWGSGRGIPPLCVSTANVNGLCGVLLNGWSDGTFSNAQYTYMRPTSSTTWEKRVLDSHDASDSNYFYQNETSADYNRVKLLSLKSAPGTLLAFGGDYGSRIYRFRSTDSGNTWSSPQMVYPITVVDDIAPDVSLTRWTWGPLMNTKLESGPDWNSSPYGTEWNADGWSDLSNVTTRTYQTFYDSMGGNIGNNVKTKDFVMHTLVSDRYFKFKFTDWGNASTGASFVYTRQEIDTSGANISAVITVTKPVTEELSDFDNISWGPNFDAVELADGNVVVVIPGAFIPPALDYTGIKYVISEDQGENFDLHGWATDAVSYGVDTSTYFQGGGYVALASGNDVVLIGADASVNNAVRFTPESGSEAPPIPPIPSTDPLVLVFATESPSDTFGLSLSSDSLVSVDWGDGTVTQHLFETTPSHMYSTSGEFIVSVQGKTSKFEIGFNQTKVTAVNSFGNLVDLAEIRFTNSSSLVAVPDALPPTVSNISQMFDGASSINDSNISFWDTSNVTNMHRMFNSASGFNQDLESWDTGNVTDMSYMFTGATDFNGNITTWNVSNVTTMEYMFWNDPLFNQPIDNWNTSNVTDMSYMFTFASAFNANISAWNVSNVTTMEGMLQSTAFNQPIGIWNTSKVTNMDNLFYNAINFNQDLSGWDTHNVVSMTSMFGSAAAFNQPIGAWDTSNVTIMQGMFTSAQVFNQDISAWNTSNVTNMQSMFQGAHAFNANISAWTVSNVTNMNFMFLDSSVFNQDLSGWCVTNIPSEPDNFATLSPLITAHKPLWGTCP